MSILRGYQMSAVVAAWDAITPDVNRVAIEMATGLGKTITFAGLIDEWLLTHQYAATNPGGRPCGRALVLVHTNELVDQAVTKLKLVTKGRWSIGVVQASQNEVSADIIVASVQTLAQPGRREQIQDVGLIVVDECHHATANTYQAILRHYRALCSCLPYEAGGDGPERDCPEHGIEGAVPVFGFTATLARSDGTGLGTAWQDLAFSRSLPWGIRHGYLIDMVPYSILIPGVNGAASDAALDAQLADSIAPEAVVRAWKDKVFDPWFFSTKTAETISTVLFAPLVRSAEAFASAFSEAGIKAEVVHGALPGAEREAILARYEAGITTVICNAMVLTEGWDSPRTSCVIIARPTKSKPLLTQMAGRGVRPWLAAEAPPREEQRCTLLVVAGAETDFFSMVADLSDNTVEPAEGKSLLAMEDEFDLGKDIPLDEVNAYRGPVRVEQWDALVQRSSKAWKYTEAGVPFLPLRKRSQLYVFIVEVAGESQVWAREVPAGTSAKARVHRLSSAPDLELAMAIAEDEALERGGDVGALLADKTRAWRKAVPSLEMLAQARRVGVDEAAIARVVSSKASGKAGKLSDLIDTVTASRVLDHNVAKIRERANA